MIAVSIVSHGHGAMVEQLIERLLVCPEVGQVIVTYNLPEVHRPFSDPRVEVISNCAAKGFGVNHNEAFRFSREPFWCVLNPDIELLGNPFPALLEALRTTSVGLVAPLITNPAGEIEDSIRYFPTVASLARKLLGRGDGRYAVDRGSAEFHPEWVAGMFMLFRADAFASVNGFDEGYFLYYEDVDICLRIWNAGMKILACPAVMAVHDARRASRVNWQHRSWHVKSMLRFLVKSFGRRPRMDRPRGA